MSDQGRKDIHEQVGDKMKPDSQKTTTEKISDSASGAYDRAAAAAVPEYAFILLSSQKFRWLNMNKFREVHYPASNG